jgi:hypothetical protein
MSTSALSQANGADLLNLLSQSRGQAPATPVDASTQVLKKALAQAQLSAFEVLAGGTPETGTLLNVTA